MTSKQRVGWGALPGALVAALQWRVMLIWIVLMALPTLILALPVSDALGSLLDHSVASTAVAQHFQGLPMTDVLYSIARHSGAVIGGAWFAGLIVTLVLSPFLTGVVVTATQGARHPRLGELMHGGLSYYWRMVRLMLWSLVPYIIAIIIGSIVYGVAEASARDDVLQSSADAGFLIARIVFVVLLVLAHAMMESSRAQFVADAQLHSATRAFGHGISMLVRRPLATLGLYVGTSVIGYVLAGLAVMWRIHVTATGAGGFIGALALAQLIVLILAWQRTARIDALARVARATPFGRRAQPANAALAPA